MESEATSIPLTAVIVSRDEADLLRGCLAAASRWADHLIVLNMESSDATPDVAREWGATLINVPHVAVVERARQRGLDAASTEWVIFLDPDELTSERIGGQCRAAVANNCDAAGFRWPFRDYWFGQPLAETRRLARKLILMHRGRVQFYDSQPAHAEPLTDGRVIDLEPGSVDPIEHHTFRDVHQISEKLTRYAMTGNPLAADRLQTSDFVLVRLLVREVLLNRAWRDGRAGIDAASVSALHDYLAALYVRQRDAALLENVPPSTQAALNAVSWAVRAIGTAVRLARRLLGPGAKGCRSRRREFSRLGRHA